MKSSSQNAIGWNHRLPSPANSYKCSDPFRRVQPPRCTSRTDPHAHPSPPALIRLALILSPQAGDSFPAFPDSHTGALGQSTPLRLSTVCQLCGTRDVRLRTMSPLGRLSGARANAADNRWSPMAIASPRAFPSSDSRRNGTSARPPNTECAPTTTALSPPAVDATVVRDEGWTSDPWSPGPDHPSVQACKRLSCISYLRRHPAHSPQHWHPRWPPSLRMMCCALRVDARRARSGQPATCSCGDETAW